MKCQKCGKEFEEKEIETSHDVPTYLFRGIRKIRKQKADKYGRHNLCKSCHSRYEQFILNTLFLNLFRHEIDLSKRDIIYYMSLIKNKCNNSEIQKKCIKICLKQKEDFFNDT